MDSPNNSGRLELSSRGSQIAQIGFVCLTKGSFFLDHQIANFIQSGQPEQFGPSRSVRSISNRRVPEISHSGSNIGSEANRLGFQKIRCFWKCVLGHFSLSGVEIRIGRVRISGKASILVVCRRKKQTLLFWFY